jgi:hypothetical protein
MIHILFTWILPICFLHLGQIIDGMEYIHSRYFAVQTTCIP